VILANVSGAGPDGGPDALLQAYVRDLGGRAGGDRRPVELRRRRLLRQPPLEETLPVEMQLRDKERIPQLTLLFVIRPLRQHANRRAERRVRIWSWRRKRSSARSSCCKDTDRTGVAVLRRERLLRARSAGGRDTTKRAELRARVGALRPGGGTSIRQGLLSADRVLRDDPSHLKHIILLTDGGSDPEGIVPAVDAMYQDYGVTTSVVAIGRDFAPWLQDVAIAGRGKFHLAYDVSTIPAIFTAETLLATRAYIVEEAFRPAINADHPIMAGIDSAPELFGYIATTPKQTATVVLSGPQKRSYLAAWQYGLGRAVAFTSDASARGAEWVDWPGYADFWTQAVQWSITKAAPAISRRTCRARRRSRLMVDGGARPGGFLNGLALDASVTNAHLDSTTIPLRQTEPGHYETVFTPEQEGSYCHYRAERPGAIATRWRRSRSGRRRAGC